MKIYLTNLAIDTTDDRFHKLEIWEKISLIEKELVHINNELQKAEYQETANHPIRAIFVAPEYFFARSAPEYYFLHLGVHVPADRVGRHYEYADYIAIRQALTSLSEKYKKILIIPGTIAWKEKNIGDDIGVPELSLSGQSSSVPYWKKGVRLDEHPYKELMKSMGENEDYCSQSWLSYYTATPDAALLEAQELQQTKYAQLSGGNGVTPEQKKATIEKITQKAMYIQGYENYIQALRKTNPSLAWNAVYFYLDGEKVEQYSKHSDYQESIYSQENVLVINHNGRSILTIKGLTIGIEICLDHACDVLKNYITEKNIVERPDIHLILSACVQPKGTYGKLRVHSSSYLPFNTTHARLNKYAHIKNRETIYIPAIRGNIECTFSQYVEVKKAEESIKNQGDFNFNQFKATVSRLVVGGYKFQLIEPPKGLKGDLKIRMTPNYQQVVAGSEVTTALTELVAQLRVAIVERGIEGSLFELKRTDYELIIRSNNLNNLKVIGTLIYSAGCDHFKPDAERLSFFRPQAAEKDDSSLPESQETNISDCTLQ